MPLMGFGGAMTLRTIVTLSSKQFIAGVNAMEARTAKFNKFLQGSQMMMLAGAAAMGAGLAISVKQAGAFEQSMANMDSVAKTTGAEFRKLKQLAFDMSKTTKAGARESADAMYWLASAGQEAVEIMETLPGVIKLASATAYDLSATTETVVATLQGFGYATWQTERVVNVFAATIGNTMANMDKLTASMQYGGHVARAAGMEVEDTAAALGILYNAGMQGSMAGTALRRVLGALISPNEALQRVLARVNLSASELDPRLHDLGDILNTLRDAGFDARDAFEAFGQRGAVAILSLTRMGKAEFDRLRTAITDTNDAADMQERQMNTLFGSLTLARHGVENLAIAMGEQAIPLFKDFAGWTAEATDKMSQAKTGTMQFSAEMMGLGLGTGLTLASIGQMAGVLGVFAAPLAFIVTLTAAAVASTRFLSSRINNLREGYEDLIGVEKLSTIAHMGNWNALKSLTGGVIGVGISVKNTTQYWRDYNEAMLETITLSRIAPASQEGLGGGGTLGGGEGGGGGGGGAGGEEDTRTAFQRLMDDMRASSALMAEQIRMDIEMAMAAVAAAQGDVVSEGETAKERLQTFLDEAWEAWEAFNESRDQQRADQAAKDKQADDEATARLQRMVNRNAGLMMQVASVTGNYMAAELERSQKFWKTIIKSVAVGALEIISIMAKAAVQTMLIKQAETLGILSLESLWNWSAWVKMAPAMARGAATIAAIEGLKGALSFHGGGYPQTGMPMIRDEGMVKVRPRREMVIDIPTAQRGGFGAATMEAAGAGGGGWNVEVNVNIGQAVMENIREDARDIGRLIAEEIHALIPR